MTNSDRFAAEVFFFQNLITFVNQIRDRMQLENLENSCFFEKSKPHSPFRKSNGCSPLPLTNNYIFV